MLDFPLFPFDLWYGKIINLEEQALPHTPQDFNVTVKINCIPRNMTKHQFKVVRFSPFINILTMQAGM